MTTQDALALANAIYRAATAPILAQLADLPPTDLATVRYVLTHAITVLPQDGEVLATHGMETFIPSGDGSCRCCVTY